MKDKRTPAEKDRRFEAMNAWCGHNWRHDECWYMVFRQLRKMENRGELAQLGERGLCNGR